MGCVSSIVASKQGREKINGRIILFLLNTCIQIIDKIQFYTPKLHFYLSFMISLSLGFINCFIFTMNYEIWLLVNAVLYCVDVVI